MNVAHILNNGGPGSSNFDPNAQQRMSSQNKPQFLQMTTENVPRSFMNNNYLEANSAQGQSGQFMLP